MSFIYSKLYEIKKRKFLKNLAIFEYENSRGSNHLKILKEANSKNYSKYKALEKQIEQLQQELGLIERNKHIKMQRTLEEYIIRTRLTEVPGLGEKLSNKIASYIYKNSLSNLYTANRLKGVGKERQYYINKWIKKYQKLLPQLLEQNFPGKDLIFYSAKVKIDEKNEHIANLTSTKNHYANLLFEIQTWIKRLSAVTEKDFVDARLGKNENDEMIDFYIKGVFADWEKVPAWFISAINESSDV